ncbi:MAG: hypothetical protein E7366_00065 [Clostridiales bacterium]|nr:hypothetical protein [Clostridiales bacterium]
MKRMFSNFLTLLLVLSMFCACGEYHGIENSSSHTVGGNSSATESSSTEKNEEEETNVFTVSLIAGGLPYTQTDGMEAQWSDGFSVYRSAFDENGVAKMQDLDGDYAVTLHGLPETYMYDPNIYQASNSQRDIVIQLYDYNRTIGKGTDTYNGAIKLTRLGGYTTEVTKANKPVYYHFSPNRSGTYIIETVEDITANEINPSFDIYNGTFAFNQFSHTLDDGGTASDYTKNVKYVIDVDASKIGSNYIFGVKATSKTGEYPITVRFLVKYQSDYADEKTEKTIIIPDQDLLVKNGKIKQPTGTLTYPEIPLGEGTYRFDETMFGLNEMDGFYHLYNETTGNYDGPILYAQITRRHRFFALNKGSEIHFANVESVGNAALTVGDGKENYKLFIEGGASVVSQGVVGMENMGHYKGLADYIANNDGVYPVTQEVKDFLQKFAISQLYFKDGNGWAETTAETELGYRIYATEADQWLFACCYYI